MTNLPPYPDPAVVNESGASPDLEVDLQVQLRASRDRIGGFRDETLRVYMAVPSERDKANARVRCLLAKTLGIARNRVEPVRGETSRAKRIRIAGIREDEFRALIPNASNS